MTDSTLPDVKRLLSEATPLPWYFEPGSRLLSARVGAEGHRRGVGDYATGYFDNDPRPEDQGSADADAELVALAVNRLPLYEAALDMLEAITDLLALRIPDRGDADDVGFDEEHDTLEIARSILSKLGRGIEESPR